MFKWFLLFSGLLFLAQNTLADTRQNHHFWLLPEQLRTAQQQLTLEEAHLGSVQTLVNNLQDELKYYQKNPLAETQIPKALERAQLRVQSSEAAIDGTAISVNDLSENIKFLNAVQLDLNKRIRTVSLSSIHFRGSAVQERERLEAELHIIEELLRVQRQRLLLLQREIGLWNERFGIEKQWLMELQEWQYSHNQLRSQEQLVNSMELLQTKEQYWLTRLTTLNKKTAMLGDLGNEANDVLEKERWVAQEHVSLGRLQMLIMRLEIRLQSLMIIPNEQWPHRLDFSKLQGSLNEITTELKESSNLVQDKIRILQKTPEYNYLRADYVVDIEQIQKMNQQIAQKQDQLYRAIHYSFSTRQTLPGWSVKAWEELGVNILRLPALVAPFFWDSFHSVLDHLHLSVFSLGMFGLFSFISIGFFWHKGRLYLQSVVDRLEEKSKRFSSNVLEVFLTIVRRNFIFLILLALTGAFDEYVGVPFGLVWMLALIALSCGISVSLAKILLLESHTHVSGKDVRLYHGLKWVLIAAGVLGSLTLMSVELPIAFDVRILFNRALMSLLIVLGVLLLQARQALPTLLQQLFRVRRRYIAQVIRLGCWLLPVTLISNGVIGLLGYVTLALAIGKFQTVTLVLLGVYFIVRGLLIDMMEFLYEILVSRVKNGWLWSQVLLKPLDRVLRMGLFLFTILVVLYFVGFLNNPVFLEHVHKIWLWPIFKFDTNEVTLRLLVMLAAIIFLLYWLAKWTREFTYRWLYSQFRDVGVRNSLAVFTQYAMVSVGVLIGFRVVGIDLRGLAVIAAAFAAGVGFGLRDIISNLISGIMLLIERPFRSGDTITLGTYEGEVVSTGIRSLKIQTWDHMEVIIPNSEMYNKPFVNWTHQDSIVRSTIAIKIVREDDPYFVKEVILNAIKTIDNVVEDPAPEVIMKEMDKELLEFEVRFHINLSVAKSRVRTRSRVMFAIWDAFKEKGIHPPCELYQVKLDRVKGCD